MRTRIVRIGNSRGIRIPKLLLEQSGLKGEVEMTAENGTLLIGPVAKARAGWAEAFREMTAQGDDVLLDDHSTTPSSWDEEEWEW